MYRYHGASYPCKPIFAGRVARVNGTFSHLNRYFCTVSFLTRVSGTKDTCLFISFKLKRLRDSENEFLSTYFHTRREHGVGERIIQ